MNNARRIARELHYTGTTTKNPTPDEAEEIRDKYGLDVPYKNEFNTEVEEFLAGEEDGEDELPEHMVPHTRMFVAGLLNDIEDELNIDIGNTDPRKIKRLDARFERIQRNVWRKVMLSKIDESVKKRVGAAIESKESMSELLMYLAMFASTNPWE